MDNITSNDKTLKIEADDNDRFEGNTYSGVEITDKDDEITMNFWIDYKGAEVEIKIPKKTLLDFLIG